MGLKVRAVALLAWAKGRRRFDFQVLTRNGREPICDLSAEKMRRERTELQKHSFLRIWKFCWQRAFLEQILWYPFLQVYLTRICWPLIFTLVLCYFGWLLMTFFLSSGPKKKKKKLKIIKCNWQFVFFHLNTKLRNFACSALWNLWHAKVNNHLSTPILSKKNQKIQSFLLVF